MLRKEDVTSLLEFKLWGVERGNGSKLVGVKWGHHGRHTRVWENLEPWSKGQLSVWNLICNGCIRPNEIREILSGRPIDTRSKEQGEKIKKLRMTATLLW